jgi:arylsulfatase A-like enzyme
VTGGRSALILTALLGALVSSCKTTSRPPNVVLVVIDTARADHFSSYGYPRPTTPHLDAFAREAIRFERAYSVSCWTVPAHASMFTGLYPATHWAGQTNVWLDDRFTTIAELLRARGYATADFSGNPWVSPTTNLVQGFDVVETMTGRPDLAPTGAKPHPTNKLIADWLGRRPTDRPFFLFVNYLEPHAPYQPPKQFEARFLPGGLSDAERAAALVPWTDWYLGRAGLTPAAAAERTALYDGEIAYADEIVSDLLEELRRAKVYDDSLIIIASDHGENLGEHGHLTHVFALYEPTARVPLLVRLPGAARGGSVRTDPVQLVDLFSTIASFAGIPIDDPEVVGRDLLGAPSPPDRPILTEFDFPLHTLERFTPEERTSAALAPIRRSLRALIVGRYKLIAGSDGKRELYDIASDPSESRNLREENPRQATSLEAQADELAARFAAPRPSPHSAPLDPATEERLRELGYVR